MRITELIRDILDIIDGAERQQPNDSVEDKGYKDSDIKRFKQIVDLANKEDTVLANEPNEQYADIYAVTQDAGADSWQGTKDPADIRGTTTRIYGDN
jgi:hypothetical protein